VSEGVPAARDDDEDDDGQDRDDDGGDAEEVLFSTQLEEWLHTDRTKSVDDLVETFGPNSFAVLFVVLMAFPALPLPPGGLSHLLEVITMLLSLELMIGRREVWIPKRWRAKELKGVTGERFSAALLKRIRWFERFARPRWASLFEHRTTSVCYGVVVFGLSLAAFFSPPFSGLDTLPSLGVVVLSLAVLFGDAVLAGIGLAMGIGGIGLVIGLGKAIFELL
jgi:hypothetical protein